MRLSFTRIGYHPTVEYALDELTRYIHIMDSKVNIDEFCTDSYDALKSEADKTLALGVGLGIEASEDDRIRISVKNGKGVITGSNPRAVLMAVYRFLYELGCRFPTPEDDGDVIPKRKLCETDVTVETDEIPSYRHRGVVLEGAVDFTQAKNMINWLPKLGLNEYFIQYIVPSQYFNRVYGYYGTPLSDTEILRLQARLVEEIKKRDLVYHAVGHTWQCVPFGIEGVYGVKKDLIVAEESKKYLALVNGKRDLIHNNPLETEVCYSNPEAREIMIRAVVNYCKEHPEVDCLHFWQSDGNNNCCECELCRDKVASDLYIPLLNELDEALEAEGIKTKIAFLCYTNLRWAPVETQLKNKDRFIFMATINHSYSKPINLFEREVSLPPYKLNQNEIPRRNEPCVASIRNWQKFFDGDSFLFDYNQIWDHYKDPGYMHCALRIASDNRALRDLGLNGLHSCQVTQAGSPTWLPTYTHGKSLWNDTLEFSDIAEEYFVAVFKEDAQKAMSWLTKLSNEFDPPYLRGEKETIDKETSERYAVLANDIRGKLPELEELSKSSEAWKKLYCHARLDLLLAEGLCSRAAGDMEAAAEKSKAIHALAYGMYEETYGALDTWLYVGVARTVLTGKPTTFAQVVETER